MYVWGESVSWIPHMIDEKRPGILQTAILKHDNTTSHRAAQSMETIKTLHFEVLDHHPYAPDLALCDLFSIFIDHECFERYNI